MQKIICDPNDVVVDFIKGLALTHPSLQYLDGLPEIKVVVHGGAYISKDSRVAVIAGCCGGNEPANAGFVGEGMLSASISGDIFQAPSIKSILAGIRTVTGTMGCLLIALNYTEDRANFHEASELARLEGYKVETVVVGDDCFVQPHGKGRRGLAGSILVFKVAGAAAAAGLSLVKVAAEANRACRLVKTTGVSLSACTLPGQETSERLSPGLMEFDAGLRGEHGEHSYLVSDAYQIFSQFYLRIYTSIQISDGEKNAVVLINGLGGTPLMELMIFTNVTVSLLEIHGISVNRIYTGHFMSSLDMKGLSLSIMNCDQDILKRLDAPTRAPYWSVGFEGDRHAVKVPVPIVPPLAALKDRIATNVRDLDAIRDVIKHDLLAVENPCVVVLNFVKMHNSPWLLNADGIETIDKIHLYLLEIISDLISEGIIALDTSSETRQLAVSVAEGILTNSAVRNNPRLVSFFRILFSFNIADAFEKKRLERYAFFFDLNKNKSDLSEFMKPYVIPTDEKPVDMTCRGDLLDYEEYVDEEPCLPKRRRKRRKRRNSSDSSG